MKRLQFICLDNINNKKEDDVRFLLAWDDGSFWLWVDREHFTPKVHHMSRMSKQEWERRGWQKVIEV